MDPLTALGVAANVAQFIDFASKLIRRSMEVSREETLVDGDHGLKCEFDPSHHRERNLRMFRKLCGEDHNIDSYISHTASHFLDHGPLHQTTTTFCDQAFEMVEVSKDWRQRIRHIPEHFRDWPRKEYTRLGFYFKDRSLHKSVESHDDIFSRVIKDGEDFGEGLDDEKDEAQNDYRPPEVDSKSPLKWSKYADSAVRRTRLDLETSFRRELFRPSQLIALGSAIGAGLFISKGESLANDGPIALFLPFCFVWMALLPVAFALWLMSSWVTVAWGSMKGLSEQAWKRLGSQIPQYGLMATMHQSLGTVFVWLGWFGFNAGTILAATTPIMAHCLADPINSRTSSSSRQKKRNSMLLGILFFGSPTNAASMRTAPGLEKQKKNCSAFRSSSERWVIGNEVEHILTLYASPVTPRIIPSHTLLLTTFLSTTFTVLLYTHVRFISASTKPQPKNQINIFLLLGLIFSSLAGAVFAVDLPDLIFRYLFFGTNLSLICSALSQRFHAKSHREQEPKACCSEKVVAGPSTN